METVALLMAEKSIYLRIYRRIQYLEIKICFLVKLKNCGWVLSGWTQLAKIKQAIFTNLSGF